MTECTRTQDTQPTTTYNMHDTSTPAKRINNHSLLVLHSTRSYLFLVVVNQFLVIGHDDRMQGKIKGRKERTQVGLSVNDGAPCCSSVIE